MKLLTLTQKLISQKSISPNDGNCQQIIADLLLKHGFEIHKQDIADTKNMLAIKGDADKPAIILLGHTDVVPEGGAWQTEPFKATIKNNTLYGRGAVDMKAAVAAMTLAATKFSTKKYKIAVMLTSDEEASGQNGIAAAISAWLPILGEISACLVGEPTSKQVIGDTIKLGRRGSINAKLQVIGIQGHAAYPDLADNAINNTAKIIELLSDIKFPSESEFPDTKICCTGLNSSSNTCNIIPGSTELSFNIRYAPNIEPCAIKKTIEQALANSGIRTELITWQPGAKPYLSTGGFFTSALIASIENCRKITPRISFDGGTSDGRHLAQYCAEVVEFGARNAYAHKVDEQIKLSELEQLLEIYNLALANINMLENA